MATPININNASLDEFKGIRERPFNLRGHYGCFVKKYSDSQCC